MISVFFKFERRIARRDWFRILLCGVFGVAGNQLLFFEGLNLTTPINASVIMTSNPVLVLVASAIILKEPLRKWKIVGVLLGGAGALLLILGRGDVSLTDSSKSMGNMLVLLNAGSYAIYLVIVKPLMRKYEPLQIIRWVFLAGLLLVAPIGFPQFVAADWSAWPTVVFFQVGYVVVCTTFLAYLLNVFALKTVSSSTASTFIYLQPLFTTLIALALAKDALSIRAAIAAGLIFTGVYLVTKK